MDSEKLDKAEEELIEGKRLVKVTNPDGSSHEFQQLSASDILSFRESGTVTSSSEASSGKVKVGCATLGGKGL